MMAFDDLQFVIVAFPSHNHLLFGSYRICAKVVLHAHAVVSSGVRGQYFGLRHSLRPYFVYTRSKGEGLHQNSRVLAQIKPDHSNT